MDVGQRAQQAAEQHLAECWEAYYAGENEPDPEKWPESPACGPFCGCETCVVREILHAAWPIFEEHAEGRSDEAVRHRQALERIAKNNSGHWGVIAREALYGRAVE